MKRSVLFFRHAKIFSYQRLVLLGFLIPIVTAEVSVETKIWFLIRSDLISNRTGEILSRVLALYQPTSLTASCPQWISKSVELQKQSISQWRCFLFMVTFIRIYNAHRWYQFFEKKQKMPLLLANDIEWEKPNINLISDEKDSDLIEFDTCWTFLLSSPPAMLLAFLISKKCHKHFWSNCVLS